ncbi:MAG: DUF3945 domain-containing protein [Muribaculum sp.]|nr:DUF3945 domain-containing protein [Muribaculum sp.]
METQIQQEEVLIARNNETGQVGAVVGQESDGTPKMTDVKSAKMSDLIKFNKGENPLEAFLSNFIRQVKNPSMFSFFKVPADRYESVGMALADFAQDPVTNADLLKDFKVEAPTIEQKKTETVEEKIPTPGVEQEKPTEKMSVIDESKIDWGDIKQKWGIDKDSLDPKDLSDMLHNRKSKLVNLNADFFGEKFNIDARLSLQTNPDGRVTLKPHFIRTEPDLSQEFHGVKFSKEDKEMLKNTGNLGRVVTLDDANGNKIPSFVSIDRLTHELQASPANVYIPPKISQTELTPKDIGILKSGKQLPKEFTDAKGSTYHVVLQYSAAEQKVEFVPRQCRLENILKKEEEEKVMKQTQQKDVPKEASEQSQKQNWTLEDGSIKPIGKWSNVHFTDQQKADYVAGKAVKVEGYIDKQGKEATVYIKFDPVKGRPFPYSKNPDEAQSIKPAAESETQLAVNNEGKTNEATKNLNDPLQKGQTMPKDDAQMKQQRKPKGPKL